MCLDSPALGLKQQTISNYRQDIKMNIMINCDQCDSYCHKCMVSPLGEPRTLHDVESYPWYGQLYDLFTLLEVAKI